MLRCDVVCDDDYVVNEDLPSTYECLRGPWFPAMHPDVVVLQCKSGFELNVTERQSILNLAAECYSHRTNILAEIT